MHDKTLTELKAGLQAGDFSSRELTEHFLERIKRHDGELNSFITVTGLNGDLINIVGICVSRILKIHRVRKG